MVRGAIYGLLAWLVYGIVEFALTCVYPLFAFDNEISSWQWRYIAEVFCIYALAGVVFGAALGAVIRGSDTGQALASLSLALAFIVNLIPAWPLARSENIALAVAAVLVISLVTAIISPEWHKRAGFLEGPWTITLLLLSGPWISRDWLHSSSGMVKAAVSWAALGALIGCSWILWRLRSRYPASIGRQSATLASAVALLGTALLFTPRTVVGSTQVASREAAGKPNVVLITMDTVRADHVSLYGYPRSTTPSLDEFAKGATVYKRAFAAADFTLPAHGSIFTGLYPAWHGAVFAPPDFAFGRPLRPTAVTLADQLRSRGYKTAAVVANRGYLFPSMGLLKGFSEIQSFGPVLLTSPDRPFFLRLGAHRVLNWFTDAAAFETISLRAEDINRRAAAALNRANTDPSSSQAPFFLFVNYMDAHQPYIPPPPFDSLFSGRNRRFRASDYEALKRAVLTDKRGLTAEERDHLISQYDGGIAYIDSEIGKLLARLRDLGVYENTLVVITSDHGEAFGEHGVLEHAVNSLYQDQIFVPLIVKYPRQSMHMESALPASQVDLMPTILAALDIPAPSGLQGRNLLADGPAILYAEARPSPEGKPGGIRRAVLNGPMKLIAAADGSREVYDLSTDPGETHNLYDPTNAATKALEQHLAGWIAETPHKEPSGTGLDKSTLERLKSLGYVQ